MHLTTLLLALCLPLSLAYTGDVIKYHPGKIGKNNACHLEYGDKDWVVAINEDMMNNTIGTNPTNNKRCGSAIKIWNPVLEKINTAFIIDICKQCGYMDLALSPILFKAVAPYAKGKHPISHGISWGGNAVGG